MDLESRVLVLECEEDNEEITNGSVTEILKEFSESNGYNNGSVAVENGYYDELHPDWEQKGAEVLVSANSTPVGFKLEQSLLKKGVGLRKWRRIRRDPNKGGDSSTDPGKMVTQDVRDSGLNASKRMLVNSERKEKSKGSVSSTNAVIGRLGSFSPLDDSGFLLGVPFSVGTDSESSEHQSSRSSTAASAPKVKYETGMVGGFPRDKNGMRSLSGKNLTNSVQRGQQGKVRIEARKEVRGEQIKVAQENSHSSMESDSRSSNFVFMDGTYSMGNGMKNERPKTSEGENGDEAQGSQQNFSDGHQGGYGRDDRRGYDDLSPEDTVADSFWDVKEDRNQNTSSRDHDTLVEAIFSLQSAQDALEKEVLKFKDVGKDISVDDSLSELHLAFLDVGQKVQTTNSKHLSNGVAVHCFPQVGQSNTIGEANCNVETELEDLFKQKIEAEVQYLVISRMVQELRVAQITILEEPKALASEQTHLLDKLGNTEKKASMLKKETEKLEHVCEDIARTDEILDLQKTVWKYSTCFFVQLVLLVLIITIFIHHISLNYEAPVPT